jgi:hypothetical protein
MKGPKKALLIWDRIPHNARLKLLNNVWCSRCQSGCGIADAHVVLNGGALLIKGHCMTCGGDAVRYVEN